jgi:hypothetical protein
MQPDFAVQTRLGPVWMWGRDTGNPVMLMLTGLFTPQGYGRDAQRALLGVDVLRAHLPGNHCPALAVPSVGTFAARTIASRLR